MMSPLKESTKSDLSFNFHKILNIIDIQQVLEWKYKAHKELNWSIYMNRQNYLCSLDIQCV